MEFAPRWTIGFYDLEFKASTLGQNFGLKFDGGTFHHLLLPVIALVKTGNQSAEFSFGAGTGINLYDVADDIGRSTTIPLIGKLGFAVSVSEKARIGVQSQLSYSILESRSDLDSVISVSVGTKLEYNF